ncbi:hypothetical protein C491_16027 [Natronococcus amylolyticus DSM 10524]|uniref:Hsp20/alpha crystallin family protein n=1 Tax=Natronococcus amylolyticus DSM 10524 TaxID=1227497 RepID=L9X194_9EURY|nr:hypothetical protein [Natronococcus amylolyticus]ELY55241.1 hypothetical protein C491_16027 [Natronococcus amylolyticus DSM 10524]
MTLDQFTREDEQIARRYEYEDGSVLAVDFGTASTDAAADIADGTVIVVDGDDQYEFELPDGAADAHTFIRNGVLTVELEGNQ